MAPCCNNIVTPKMIKAGRVSVGDRIQFEDDYIAAQSDDLAVSEKKQSPAEQAVSAEQAAPASAPEAAAAAAPAMSSSIPDGTPSSSSLAFNSSETATGTAEGRTQFAPLPYSQMTSYMSNVSINGPMDSPSVITPQDPMTPNGFDSSIDLDAVQTLNGFLRTQIGRYMRIEQLVGSNTIQDRFGFLVGVGSNFIILQEITTGNIMVLDIFSVRLAYVYYSQPVLPNI